jgi:hypothetical protein
MTSHELDLQPLSPLVRKLIERERERPGQSPEAQQRLEQRIESSLDWLDAEALPVASRPRPLVVEPERRAPPAVPKRWRLIAAASLVGAVAFGAVAHATYVVVARRWLRKPAAVQVVPAPPAPVPAPAEERTEVLTPVPPPSAPAPARKLASATNRVPQQLPREGSRQLSSERSLLDIARTALGLGRLPEAQAALEKHRQLYPRGQLAEERESLAVQVLVSLGALKQARAQAARFHARYPASIFWPSMREMLSKAGERP